MSDGHDDIRPEHDDIRPEHDDVCPEHDSRYQAVGCTRRRTLASIGVGVSVLLAGCGYRPGAGEFAWEMQVGSPSTGPFGGRREWLGDDERFVSVTNHGGRTFDTERDRWVDVDEARVIAYDSSGTMVWSGTTDTQFEGEPAMDGESVYVPLADGRVSAVSRGNTEDAPGAVRWTTPELEAELALDARSQTANDGGDLVLGWKAETVYGVDSGTGDVLFETEFDAPIQTTAVADDTVWIGVGTVAVDLVCLDIDGERQSEPSLPGEVDWLQPVGTNVLAGVSGSESGIYALASTADIEWYIAGSPGQQPPEVVEDQLYYVGGGELFAVDLTGEELLWERDSPFEGEIVADDDGVYGTRTVSDGLDTECRLVAVTDDGEVWWDVAAVDALDCSSTRYLVDDRIVFVDDNSVHAVRRTTANRWSLL